VQRTGDGGAAFDEAFDRGGALHAHARPTADEWIARLALMPHPEGGWYRETYRSRERVDGAALPPRFGGARVLSTAIYYLLRAGERSALHRIKSDEVWHHYAGDAVTLWLLEVPGCAKCVRLGGDGEPQVLVPAGAWYGGRVIEGGAYALMGGTVAPGFEFADFELADRAALLAAWPEHRQVIEDLTAATPHT
jgi:predicted cupin superfamily sugar epimerase